MTETGTCGNRPRLLDLFSGAGGAARGYQLAGFHVTGVDINPQPRYAGDEFHRGDALTWPLDGYNAIHASPPCQAYTTMGNRCRKQHPDLLSATLERLQSLSIPWVVENVPGARTHMGEPFGLHGGMFGLGVHRYRLFTSNMLIFGFNAPPVEHPIGVYGSLDGRRLFTRTDGSIQRAARTLEEAQQAMSIDWMTWDELREAIPPAYTRFIGEQLLDQMAVAS